jgi:hypothetical protein
MLMLEYSYPYNEDGTHDIAIILEWLWGEPGMREGE